MSILLKNGLIIDYKNNFTKRADIYINNGIIEEIAESIEKDADKVINCLGLSIVPGFIDLYCMLDDERKIDVTRSSLDSSVMGGYTALCIHGKYKDYDKNVCNIFDSNKIEENYNKVIYEPIENTGINEGDVAERIDAYGENPDDEINIVKKALLNAEQKKESLFINKISTKESVKLIKEAKKRGVKVTCSTCPHYYSFNVNNILESGVNSKTNPPLRTEEDRQAIVIGIKDGIIDCIVTDNTPISEDAKSMGIVLAPTGVIGFETALSSVLTLLIDSGNITYKELVKLLSYNPAKILGIDRGTIEVGKIADLVVFDPVREFVFAKEKIVSSSKNSPFIGRRLKGHVKYTIYNGEIVYERNKRTIK